MNPKYVWWTHGVEEHAVPDAGLDVLRPGVARVLPQEAPRGGLAAVGVQAAELGLRCAAVLHAAVARQDAPAERVDHVLLRVHAHLAKRAGRTTGSVRVESEFRIDRIKLMSQ